MIPQYLVSLGHTVTEVRILRKERYLNKTRHYTGDTVSGYYEPEAYERLEKDIAKYEADPGTKAIYTTLHDCKPELLHRAKNRLRENAQDTTSDHDITAFTVFPMDIDPARPAGISSSDADLEGAKKKIAAVHRAFVDAGIPETAIAKAMSGNGWHLLIYLNPLPTTGETVEAFKALGDRIAGHFGLDTTIYNPSRIWKLYGTTSRKGDNTEERPHRQAKVWFPQTLERIDFSDLSEKWTTAFPVTATPEVPNPTASKNKSRRSAATSDLTLREWLDRHQIAWTEKPYKGTSKFQVDCPHDASHKSPDAWVTDEGGAWQFSCSHNSCKGERSTWKAFKAAHHIEDRKPKGQGKKGRKRAADKAVAIEIPETHNALPIVMMQEIIDKDGDKSISERPRHVVSDDVVQHLWFNGNQDRIYRRGREIGTLVASEVGLAFNPASKYAMQGEISRAVTLMRFSPNDGRLIALGNPPSWLADDILLNQDRTDVPQVKVIITHPFWDGDRIVTEKGFDAASGVFLDSDVTFSLDLAAHTAEDDIQLWRDLLCDFPFKDESDFENAMGYVLTLIVRQGLQDGETVPLVEVTAPREGVGKSLLAKVLTAAVTGKHPVTRSLSEKRAEIEKEIGAALRAAPEIVILDNVDPKAKLDSGVLASVITEPNRAFRILGFSDEAHFENRATMLYTGSNVEVTPELAKRLMAIRLIDPGIAEKDRTVKREGILSWTLENHQKLCASALRMVQRWIAAGSKECEKTSHRMRQWSRVVRGIMQANGFGGHFLANTDEVMLETNPEFTDWTNAFKAIVDLLGPEQAQEGWTVRTVFLLLSYESAVYTPESEYRRSSEHYTREARGEDILGDLIGDRRDDNARRKALSSLLKKKNGAVFAGWELVDLHKTTREKLKIYALKPRKGAYGLEEAPTGQVPTGQEPDWTDFDIANAVDGVRVDARTALSKIIMEITGKSEGVAKAYPSYLEKEGLLEMVSDEEGKRIYRSVKNLESEVPF